MSITSNNLTIFLESIPDSTSIVQEKIGVTKRTISNIKTGKNSPRAALLEKVKASYPNLNLNWLISGEGDMIINEDETAALKKEISYLKEVNDLQKKTIELLKEKLTR